MVVPERRAEHAALARTRCRCIFVAKDADRFALHDGGLVDVAPTLLGLLGLPVPGRMTGRSLLDRPAS